MGAKFLGWRCWYDDGTIYNSRNHKWVDLPEDGVLVKILYYANGGKQVQHGMDFYYEAPHCCGDSIRGTAMPNDDVGNRYPSAEVKRGRWAPDEFYRQIVEEAMISTWEE